MTVEKPNNLIIRRKILLVDDHPFIIEGYKNAIVRYEPDKYEFLISQAKDCQSGYETIINEGNNDFDVAFLDISMPPYPEKNMFSGEDLAKVIQQKIPNCKIILLTMFSELLKIKTIIQTINPSGLIIKNDLTFDELLIAFDRVINDEKYYSQSVIKLVEDSSIQDIEIDDIDRQILLHLAKGSYEFDLSHFLPISIMAIEKRKKSLKEILKIENESDEVLVKKAISEGLIKL